MSMENNRLIDILKLFITTEELSTVEKDRMCDEIKDSLNGIFPNFKCKCVMYTKNMDNEFFGCRIYPFIKGHHKKDLDIVMSRDKEYEIVPFDSYILELDSKLFTGSVIFEPKEIALLICNDINNITGTKPMCNFIDMLNHVLCETDTVLDFNAMEKCYELFSFVLCETIRYMTSVFCQNSYNDLSGFSSSYTFSENEQEKEIFEHACRKVQILNPEFNGENPAKFSCACLLIEWYLKVYQTIDKDRYTITLLKKAIDYSGSVLFKNKVQGIINYLDSAFWNFVDTYAVESAKPGFFTKIKLDGLKSIEDDLYEYKMRIRNVETQDDALLLMRQINNRMAILDEYLLENDDIPERDRKRWETLFEKYSKLREELSEKSVYTRKMYGLFVDYNALQQMYNNTNTTMNTYY